MQVAALADIHGNIQALDAVLADPRLPEQVLVLGDVVAGTFPTECYDRLAELGERARILRGNAALFRLRCRARGRPLLPRDPARRR